MSDNRPNSSPLRLARAPRGALRGPRPSVFPATFARRPVRRSPASRSAVSRHPATEHARREPFSGDPVDAVVSWPGDYQVPEFFIDTQGSFGLCAVPRCRSSIEMPSGERMNAILPSLGGRLIVTPASIKRWHSA